MFRNAFLVKGKIFPEIEASIGWQFPQRRELADNSVESSMHVRVWKLCQVGPGPRECFLRQLIKAFAAQLMSIFAVQPGAFVEIERGILAVNLFELEQPNDFIQLDLLAIVLG